MLVRLDYFVGFKYPQLTPPLVTSFKPPLFLNFKKNTL